MQGFHGNHSCGEPQGRGSGNRPHVGEGEGQVGAGKRCGPFSCFSRPLSTAGPRARPCGGTPRRPAAPLGCLPGGQVQV